MPFGGTSRLHTAGQVRTHHRVVPDGVAEAVAARRVWAAVADTLPARYRAGVPPPPPSLCVVVRRAARGEPPRPW